MADRQDDGAVDIEVIDRQEEDDEGYTVTFIATPKAG